MSKMNNPHLTPAGLLPPVDTLKLDQLGRVILPPGITPPASGDSGFVSRAMIGSSSPGYSVAMMTDEFCSPDENCTLKQCGCGTDTQCSCPPPDSQCFCVPPDSQCTCPPPDSQCNCPPPDSQCNCPPPDSDCYCPPEDQCTLKQCAC